MGEKYDGVRACWNPVRHTLYLKKKKNKKKREYILLICIKFVCPN